MNRDTFLKKQREARSGWQQVLDRLTARPELQQDERIKALVIHINWYEREMLGVLRQRALAGSELWELHTDERNAEIERRERRRLLAELIAESQVNYVALLAELARLPDEAFQSAHYFENMPESWTPWEVIASNLFEHYDEHAGEIQEILNR